MMRHLYVIQSLLLWYVSCSVAAYGETKEQSDEPLLANGANVCSYKEVRLVQVNTSFLDIRTVSEQVTYKTTNFWGIPVYRKRTVLREKTSIKYFMQPKLREVDIHLCCSGWSRAEGSKECRIPVCAIGCDNGGKCTAPDKCTCAPGFEGKFCQNYINECKDAEKNTCEQDCVNTRGGFQCFCKRGFIIDPKDASKCLDINECNASRCTCKSGDPQCNAVCTNTYGSYKCSCSQGYRLYADGTCRDINECIQDVCSHFCVNLPGSYRCDCMPGFVFNATTGKCQDNNECAIRNGGCNQKCHNVEGGYVCSCNDNFYLTEDRRTCKAIPGHIEFQRLCVNSTENFVVKSCWPSTLKILSAFYGRIEDSHCKSQGKPFKSCSVNGITKFLRDLCSGKSTCFIEASYEALSSLVDPCPEVDKYVEITSTCVVKDLNPSVDP